MLQFWKKSKADNEKQFATTNKTNDSFNTPTFKSTDPKLSFLASLEDEGLCDIDQFETTRKKSKLSRTLQDVLTDKSALTYFVQYMESKKASRYVMCWLDIDSLKSFISQGRESNILSPILSCQVDHDSLSVSTDCDSITTDTNSLCDDSTLVTTERVVQNCTEMSVNESSLKMNSEELGTIEGKRKGRLVENAISIFKKYVAQEAVHKIMFSELIRKEVIENICDAEKVLLGNCFDKVQSSVCDVMEREYFDAFLESDYFCKYQIDVLTSMDVSLDDILHNETALFYFMEYLQQENCCNFLEFWIAATNLQQQLQNQKEFFDPIEAQNDAVVLYDKYFSLQAHCPLGLGDKVRFQVEQNICGEHGLVIDCFNLPLRLIEVILEKNFLKPFLASQLFYNFRDQF